MLTFIQRATHCHNPTARKLFEIMTEKQSNLALSLDVVDAKSLLDLADRLGPEICILKTHIDILQDFDQAVPKALTELALKHNFLIFEDRKFADIGHTVQLQYERGIYQIAQWAAITNAHPVPGPGVIEGLKKVGLPLGNGLLLVAEMSSKGNLAQGEYTQQAINMALLHPDFVIGFITQHKLADEPWLINMTPGVQLATRQDDLGQQYTTPEQAIVHHDNDIIIVGRGIYQAADPLETAQRYRQAGWQAYLSKISQ